MIDFAIFHIFEVLCNFYLIFNFEQFLICWFFNVLILTGKHESLLVPFSV